MKGRTARILCYGVLIASGQMVNGDSNTVVLSSRQAAIERSRLCDPFGAWQLPAQTPKAISMALVGLGLVAVGAVTRRSSIKRS